MTVGTLAEHAADAVGEDYTDYETQLMFLRLVVEAIEEIHSFKWPFTAISDEVTTSATVQGYAVDADVAEIRGAYLGGTIDKPLKYLHGPEALWDQGFDHDLAGEPRYVWIERLDPGTLAFEIMLWPIPDGTYTVQLFSNSRITEGYGSDSDTVDLPADFFRIIRLAVTRDYYIHVERADLATAFSQRHQAAFDAMRDRYKTPAAQRYQMAWTDMPEGDIIFPIPRVPRLIS